jgi:hypothetical protein
MVVIMLISILTTFTLVALAGATEKAKEDRTRTQIAKINELIMTKWESYQYRTVPPTNYANGLAVKISRKGVKRALEEVAGSQLERYQERFSTILATDRLLATRELMRMEMPCQYEEVALASTRLRDLVTGGSYIPAVHRAYRNRASAEWDRGNGSAECLYMIISQMREADRSALEFFKENEIGDVDGDGMKEILDAWGKPIVWLRWAPSFVSPLQRPLIQKDADGNLVEDPGQEDVLDPARVGSAYKLANFTGTYLGLPRTLYPLILSAGPDGKYGIVLDTIEDSGQINTWMDLNHDPYDRNERIKMYRLGAEFDVASGDAADNISNHLLTTR